MKPWAEIYNELKTIAPFLAEQDKVNVYTVPDNYFSRLGAAILNKISNDFYKLPASESQVFHVPGDYFENLAGNILQKIKSLESDDANNDIKEELKNISPVLSFLKKENVFTVPENYFENLSANSLSIARPQAKVVTMKKKSMWLNSAAAAVLTGIMAAGALWMTNNSTRQNNAVAQDVSLNIRNAEQYKNEQQVNEAIAKLADADIINYLEATGSKADDEALASGIPDSQLPSEQDYLTNENALQNFLGEQPLNKNQN